MVRVFPTTAARGRTVVRTYWGHWDLAMAIRSFGWRISRTTEILGASGWFSHWLDRPGSRHGLGPPVLGWALRSTTTRRWLC